MNPYIAVTAIWAYGAAVALEFYIRQRLEERRVAKMLGECK